MDGRSIKKWKKERADATGKNTWCLKQGHSDLFSFIYDSDPDNSQNPSIAEKLR